MRKDKSINQYLRGIDTNKKDKINKQRIHSLLNKYNSPASRRSKINISQMSNPNDDSYQGLKNLMYE